MELIFTILSLAALLWVGYSIWTGYASAQGAPSERLWQGFRASATVIVGKVTAAVGGLLTLVPSAADLVGSPEIKTALEGLLTPKAMSVAVLAIGLVTVWARTRTLGKS